MVLAAVLVIAQSPVSFTEPAAPMSRLLPQIGKVAGVKLTADNRLAGEVLLVHVKALPLATLMARIAKTTGAEWEKRNDGGFRLNLSAAVDAKQHLAEAIARGEKLHQVFAKNAEQFAKLTNDGAPSGLPETVLSRFPAEILGGIGVRQRLVYSTKPTAMQRLMPAGILSGLDFSRIRKMQRFDGENQPYPAPGVPAVTLLILQADPDLSGVRGRLLVADAVGTVIGGEDTMMSSGAENPEPIPTTLPLPDASIALTGTSLKLAKAIATQEEFQPRGMMGRSDSSGGPGTTLYSPEELSGILVQGLENRLDHPASEDPLAPVLGAALEKLADAEKTDVVALLPDSAFLPSARFLSTGIAKAVDLEQDAREHWGLDVTAESGWLRIAPQRPAAARDSRTNRVAFEKLLRALSVTHDLSLNDQTAFAVAQPLTLPSNSLEGPVIGLTDPGWARRIALSSPSGERQLLRIVRALGTETASTATRTFGSLSAPVRAQIADLMFGSPDGPAIEHTVVFPNRTIANHQQHDSPFIVPETLFTERTIMFASGIPAETPFQFLKTTQNAFAGITPSGIRPILTGKGQMGSNWSRGKGIHSATNSPRLGAYLPCRIDNFALIIGTGEKWSFERSLYETQIDPNAPQVAFENLPGDFQKQIADSEKQMADALERMNSRRNRVQP